MKQIKVLWPVWAALWLGGEVALAQPQTVSPQPVPFEVATREYRDEVMPKMSTPQLFELLLSPDQTVRPNAQGLLVGRVGGSQTLVNTLGKVLKDRGPDFHEMTGRFNTLLRLVGKERVTNAAGYLMSEIKYKTNARATQKDHKRDLLERYAVVRTLIEIDDKEIVNNIFQHYLDSASDEWMRANTYVLKELLGIDALKVVARSRLKSGGSDNQKNMERILELLEKPDDILPLPPEDAQSLQSAPVKVEIPAALKAQTATQFTGDLIERLATANDVARAAITQELQRRRDEVEQGLLAMFDRLMKEKPPGYADFDGPLDEVISAFRLLRMKQALGRLVPIVDFRLQGMRPGGGFGGPESYYPVIWALSDIGGKDVVNAIFERLRQPTTEGQLRAFAHVLSQGYGNWGTAYAKLFIRQELERIVEITTPNPQLTVAKANLEALLRWLDYKGTLLEEPKQ